MAGDNAHLVAFGIDQANFTSSNFRVQARFAVFLLTPRRCKSDVGILKLIDQISVASVAPVDFLAQFGDKVIQAHAAEILAATGADGDLTLFHFAIPNHHEVGDALQS